MSSTSSSAVDLQAVAANPYRKYVDKYLKTKGLRKTMQFLHRLIRGPLRRAQWALQRPAGMSRFCRSLQHLDCSFMFLTSTGDFMASNVDPDSSFSRSSYHPHLEERFSSHPDTADEARELSQFGVWNPEFVRMNLPSFRAPYLFLCRVPLDVIHECLKIRLEQKPQEPSELSIRQVTECARCVGLRQC